jgi:tetratricopeptide (TPR) repeat protein
MVGFCLCLAVTAGTGQDNTAAQANELYTAGKRLQALPLYEELAKANPKEWIYFERLADCLAVKSHDSDPAQAKVLRTRMRDAARQAVGLGDPNAIMKVLASVDPDLIPGPIAPSSPASSILEDAEKAFRAGDYPAAMAKYVEAADADPRLYEAPLYAGDIAFRQQDAATAGKWFARAIAADPNRETAYRYWGDTLLRVQNDPAAAESKFIDAVVAEPYNKMSWQGLQNWAAREKGVIRAPKIDRPAGPVVDAKNPKNIAIDIDPVATDDKQHPGSSAWMMYSLMRGGYHGDLFKKNFPNEKVYRHSLKEEDLALSMVATTVKERKIKPENLDENLRNLVELNDAGMLDCWILINGADQGIAQDYDAYRKDHRQLLHDYLARFVVHGAASPAP